MRIEMPIPLLYTIEYSTGCAYAENRDAGMAGYLLSSSGGLMRLGKKWQRISIGILALMLLATAPTLPVAIALPGDRLHPESISITPDGTAYVGSMTGGVIRVSLKDRRAEQWIAPAAYGSGALFGVFADTRNGLLWTCTNSFSAPATVVTGADPGHWLKGFDLLSGEGKISLSLPGDKPVCNDMAVAKDGSVYIADTGQPHILRWKPGATALEIWADDPVFEAIPRKGGLDGIAFGADGNLYLNNVRDGAIYRAVVKKDGSFGGAIKLTLSRSLESPDGMRSLGGMSFIVAESVGRISILKVSGDKADITTVSETGYPTGVDTYKGTAWYVEGKLSALFAPDKTPPPAPPFYMTPVVLPR